MSETLQLLTKKQQEAVYALADPSLAILSDVELARRLGVNDRSLRRWRLMPEFQDALQAIRHRSQPLRRSAHVSHDPASAVV